MFKILVLLLAGLGYAELDAPTFSQENDTNTVLVDGGTFTGDWVDVEPYSRVKASVFTNAPGNLFIEFSSDRETLMTQRAFSTDGKDEFSVEAIRKWARLVYKDAADGNVQTVFDLKMKLDHGTKSGNQVGASDRAPSESDAFGRLRTSETNQRLDVEFIYDKQVEFFDEITTSGTVTHNTNSRDLVLSLANADNGSQAKMASYPVPYTPGNSQLIEITGTLDAASLGGGTAEFFLRSTVTGATTEEAVSQSDWQNLSKVADLDWSTSHIFAMDFQSLKVGRIRYGLVKNGIFIQVGQITNDNKRSTGFWQLPNQPVYYNLYTTAGQTYMELGYGDESNAIGFRYKVAANAAATMRAICSTVKSEGGGELREMAGLPRSIDRGITTKVVSTSLVPLLSIRAKDLYKTLSNKTLIVPKGYTINTDGPIRVVLISGATLTGAAWADIDANNSAVEYDLTATALTGGIVIDSGYVTTSGTGVTERGGGSGLLGKSYLWNRLGSQTGIFTLAAVRTGASDADVLSSLSWEEIR